MFYNKKIPPKYFEKYKLKYFAVSRIFVFIRLPYKNIIKL